MYELGITSGCFFDGINRDFCPTRNTINLEAAIFTVRTRQLADGAPINDFPYSLSPYFADFPSSDGNFKFIQRLHELGGVNNGIASPGCPAGNFCQSVEINRGEKARYVVRGILNDWNN